MASRSHKAIWVGGKALKRDSAEPSPFMYIVTNPICAIILPFPVPVWKIVHLETVHSISPLGSDCGAYTSQSLPVFLRPLCQLISAIDQLAVLVYYVQGTDQSRNNVCLAENSRPLSPWAQLPESVHTSCTWCSVRWRSRPLQTWTW